MHKLFTTSDYVARIRDEQSKLEKSVLKTPPATWDQFLKLVGKYAGLEEAANAIIELSRSAEQEEADDDDRWSNQKPRSRT